MFISKQYRSPYFHKNTIPVEFVILHYTAQSLKESLKIFLSNEKPTVSCHFLIDEKGKVYELVSSYEGACMKAFHAGKSHFLDSAGKKWESFNNFSIGIELINWNGNIIPFTEEQYKSLFELLCYLKNIYPSLQNPERILGHEHIAGFRGKSDPGYLFDWKKLFQNVYPDHSLPNRDSVITKKQHQSLVFLKNSQKWNDQKARRISLLMEKPLPFWLKKIFFWLLIQ